MLKMDYTIDLVAAAYWVSYMAEGETDAEAFSQAANLWCRTRDFQTPLQNCPYEEHIPESAFSVDFEAGENEEGRWAVYCYCSWTLKHDLETVADAVSEAEQYFDTAGVSEMELEQIVFGSNYGLDFLEDGRPVGVFDPELRIYDDNQEYPDDEYILGGVVGAITITAGPSLLT